MTFHVWLACARKIVSWFCFGPFLPNILSLSDPKGSDLNFNPLSQYHFCRSFSSLLQQSCSRLRFCIEFCKPQCNFPFFNSHPRYNSIHLNLNKLFQHETFHPRNPSFLCCCLCSPGKQVHICSYPGCYGRPCSYC